MTDDPKKRNDQSERYDDFLAGIDQMQAVEREKQFLKGISEHGGGEDDLTVLGPLGDRVRGIREQKGLSLADVASRTGFDPGYLARIESSEVAPPLGALIKLAKALDMKMGYFLGTGEAVAYSVVRKDERRKISRRARTEDKKYGYTYQSLAPNMADRKMEPFLVTLEPSEDVQTSTHAGQEFIFVLDGRMEAIVGEDRIVLDAGDSIYYDSTVAHMVRCVDGPQTLILAVLYTNDK
jgi:transcriptional regulator with XRE-family HTH domain